MIPGPFNYHRPATVADAVKLLSTFGDEAATAARVERAFARAQTLRVGPYLEAMDRFLAEALEAAPS